jgi:hypothetical protein
MNMSYETIARLATVGAVASWIVFMVCGLTVFRYAYRGVIVWMRKCGRPYSDEIWFGRCLTIYLFLFLLFTSGFDIFAKILLAFIVISLVVGNPWMINYIEKQRTHPRKEPCK